MVLVDAAFVVEALLRNWFGELEDERNRAFNKPWMLQAVFPDLWLLENQLPFFILDDVLVTVPTGDTERLSLTKLSYNFFYGLLDFEFEPDIFENINSSKILHFVDFVRKLNVLTSCKNSSAEGKLKSLTLPRVSELYQCGVKIKLRSGNNLFDIRFSKGVLEIPKVIVSSMAEITTRNILTFEQRHCRENRVNDLFVTMNRLVSSPKDVNLLLKHGIVENKLGCRWQH
ncbi:hypothetical protein PanWU01x14_169900 [Parasponia andersonii]|uniref:Uncharacterized protein n=1 Tax=Parasponia andersonii TaxID=3476 RepID=A0A2P5CA14_PARAD|nr:hypothetical protein PanWU01x14_169900 [Parasponia andersonii]